ncbi:MAG: osmotically inducible protein OsmC [Candidatus Marinimicrobia bacterium]|nr:osmotically inducible protein OsmC [Candidatus Neomarinimicrobiota bacterium]|tara:strand:+ start:7432 stop:7842 length:411 start_codon:yes stop_codon:yes gene_type:complete
MSDIKIVYNGDLRTQITHSQSGDVIITDAPIDNNGKGEAFSPTDLFASSLGSCMLTIMGITAQTHGLNIDGSTVNINKIMGTNPRRVSAIDIIININGKLNEKDKKILQKAAEHCPVSKSIHPDLDEKITFNFLDK